MISINLLQEEALAIVTRMPVVEFGGRIGDLEGHLYEIVLGENLTLVLDEQQTVELSEAILDALPPMFDRNDEDPEVNA